MQQMIQLQGISKTYQHLTTDFTALSNINLTVQRAEIMGVIGPSGAGKSTLLRCVNLLERPSTGKVIVDGQELTALTPLALREHQRKIGMIFQSFNLLSSRNVYDNIALPLELLGQTPTQQRERIEPLLKLTGLENKRTAYPSQLSGGQKQRVAIARALASEPRVLLCDEVTSALDVHTTHEILALLSDINRKLGVTLLLITHSMDVVKQICHRLALIDQGQIVEEADVLTFFTRPTSERAKRFIRRDIRELLPQSMRAAFSVEPSFQSHPLLRISFLGQVAEQPIISQLMRKFPIEFNILHANIEHVREQSMGVMIVQTSGTMATIQEALTLLQAEHVNAEIIGYVKY